MIAPVFRALLALSLMAAAGCSQTENAKENPAPDIAGLMDAANIPGLAVATITDCALKDVSYYGVADVETGEPVGPDTIFEAASLTKTLFTVIVNQLADEGVIDLDKPLADDFDYPRVTDKDAYAKLTPRIILEHRSGFPNWASDPLDKETWGSIEFKNPPDTKFGYSGEAYMLLQAYVESRTGESLDRLFEDRLGDVMAHSMLSAPIKPGMTPAFGHDENGGKEAGRAMKPAPRAGAAYSALTNAQDYAQFLAYVCNGAGMDIGARGDMLRPQSPTDDPEIVWALGWGVQSRDDGVVYFHWGDNKQFKAFAAFNPATRDGVVYFANAYNGLKLIEPIAEPVVGDVTPIADWLDYGRVD
ncbi:serine hydrolase domain-containing protein [Hyphococcus luteus]|uniref:Beta-lactamase-related domain-containing protein n=1 Tax=Hyphococcus luteus TaxID=2058213 RepID=A0A2S7K2I4_9PROT|nr:serine hydrolase domain-containing protein [Marinicaulis flavus]PQA86706.1 hypothetical protein CW354_14535 [Marinicaulis flavus]